jgi:hypothetical protein
MGGVGVEVTVEEGVVRVPVLLLLLL